MSEMSKQARKDMRAKTVRLSGGGIGSNDPQKKVDASSWTPPEALDAGRKTGARPIRARIYKHGGKIQGDRAPRNAGKAPRARRADGGRTPYSEDAWKDEYMRQQTLKAKQPQPKPEPQKRADGGRTGTGPLSMIDTANENKRTYGSFHEGGYKRGGMPKMGDMAAIKKGHHDPAAHEKAGTYFGGTRPAGGRIPRAHGGRTKGKTNINIVIAQPKANGGPMQGQMMPPQGPVKPPMPPPQMQPPAGGPPMPPPMGGMPPPPGGPPMMRKQGGRANADAIPIKHAGAGSGEGRLERMKIQTRSNRRQGGRTASA